MNYEEAIKLKPGTPIFIRSKVVSVDVTGDIVYETHAHDQEYDVTHARTDCHYADVQTPEQKLDTCRLFKKGDIVRYVERDGRSYVDAPPVGATCRVIVGEDSAEIVTIEFKFSETEEPAVHDVPFYHLKLITSVEEMEPFTVVHKPALQHFQINHGKLNYMTFPYGLHKSNGWYHTITTAKVAAETECARLNAEWRKENGNE